MCRGSIDGRLTRSSDANTPDAEPMTRENRRSGPGAFGAVSPPVGSVPPGRDVLYSAPRTSLRLSLTSPPPRPRPPSRAAPSGRLGLRRTLEASRVALKGICRPKDQGERGSPLVRGVCPASSSRALSSPGQPSAPAARVRLVSARRSASSRSSSAGVWSTCDIAAAIARCPASSSTSRCISCATRR